MKLPEMMLGAGWVRGEGGVVGEFSYILFRV